MLKLVTHPWRNNLPCAKDHTITYVALQICKERYKGRLDEDEEQEPGSQEVQEEADL